MRAFWLLTRTHDSVSPERVTASNRTGLILQDKQRQESGVSGHGGSPCREAPGQACGHQERYAEAQVRF